MIYSKIETPKCYLCVYADISAGNGNAVCKFKGTVPEDFSCKKFKYDIFKKSVKPKKKLDTSKFTKEDFII